MKNCNRPINRKSRLPGSCFFLLYHYTIGNSDRLDEFKIKTTSKRRGFLCGYKPLLPARVSRRCFHFVQAIAFDSRQPSKGFVFCYFFLFAFSCLYACCSASENGFAYSFTLILSIAISCISCSRIYFATVTSFNPTVLT